MLLNCQPNASVLRFPFPMTSINCANVMRYPLPTEEGWEPLPPIPESEMPEWLLGAKRAMERATEKELDRKRKLGYKIVIWKDRKVQVVDP